MREPTAADWSNLGFWWILYGVASWCLLLIIGYTCLRLAPKAGRYARGWTWLLGATAAAGIASLSTSQRAGILIEQGVVQSAQTMNLYSFTLSLTIALLYFAHLQRARTHEAAVARLAEAQAAQREARASCNRACKRCRLESIRGCSSNSSMPCGVRTKSMQPAPRACSMN